MNDQMNERWQQLCQLAAVEPDSNKLSKLIAEVNFLLDTRDDVALAAARRSQTRV